MRFIKRLLMVIGGLAVAFVALGVVAVMSSDKKPGSVPAAAAASAAAGPAAVEVYETTVAKLEADYRANEIATDERIGSRPVRVSGRLTAIEKDFLGHPMLALATSNEFMPARMTLDKADLAAAAKLTSGQKVSIVCEQMRLIVGSPTGSGCRLM
jgi:hypothetical protein